jgi:hypothetical protein
MRNVIGGFGFCDIFGGLRQVKLGVSDFRRSRFVVSPTSFSGFSVYLL